MCFCVNVSLVLLLLIFLSYVIRGNDCRHRCINFFLNITKSMILYVNVVLLDKNSR